MTIRLGYSAQKDHFFIEMNDALMLCDGGFNVEDTLQLDDYVELIFDDNKPFHVEVYSNEHDLMRYDYMVRIHQSLVHCGEDEPAIFNTTDRELAKYIGANVVPGRVTSIRLKRKTHRKHTWYELDLTPFRKGLHDPSRHT